MIKHAKIASPASLSSGRNKAMATLDALIEKPKTIVHRIVQTPLGTIEMLDCDPGYVGPATGSYNEAKVTCPKCLALRARQRKEPGK